MDGWIRRAETRARRFACSLSLEVAECPSAGHQPCEIYYFWVVSVISREVKISFSLFSFLKKSEVEVEVVQVSPQSQIRNSIRKQIDLRITILASIQFNLLANDSSFLIVASRFHLTMADTSVLHSLESAKGKL